MPGDCCSPCAVASTRATLRGLRQPGAFARLARNGCRARGPGRPNCGSTRRSACRCARAEPSRPVLMRCSSCTAIMPPVRARRDMWSRSWVRASMASSPPDPATRTSSMVAQSLDHLHRVRALSDAVLIGVGTALADGPRLTTRNVVGPNAVRVVIDPRGRLPAEMRAPVRRCGATLVIRATDGPDLRGQDLRSGDRVAPSRRRMAPSRRMRSSARWPSAASVACSSRAGGSRSGGSSRPG